MKKYFLSLVGILTTVIICLFVGATPTFAEDAGRVDKLERLVETQQRQLAEQKKQLDALLRMVQDLQAQKQSPASDAGTDGATPAAAKPPDPAKTPASTGFASAPDPERKPMSAPPAKTTASLPEAADKPLPEIGGGAVPGLET